MSEPENLQNERQSDSDPWLKNERRAESEPGKKERVPSSGIYPNLQKLVRLGSFHLFNICILPLPEESDCERMPTPPDQWDCGDMNSIYDDPDSFTWTIGQSRLHVTDDDNQVVSYIFWC